jgi:catechol 2,3-dioxygenase-like lactoylglutathione lyase family enzyme
MINATSVAFTGYPVTDMARARAFYEGVLGLKTGDTWEHEGRHWIEYDLGPATIAITNMSPQWKPSNDGPSVALEVANFDAAIATLRAQQVKFDIEPTESPVCRLAVIRDPDGNSIAIHRRHAG